jgi:hypothetical protein
LLGHVIFAEKRTGRARPTGDVDATLDAERHAKKRPKLRAAQHKILCSVALLEGPLGVQMDKRIQFRLECLDAFQMEFEKFDGGDILGTDFPADFR